MKPFTAERLLRIRRLRKARRLYKQSPIFAYDLMRVEYPTYTHDEFWDDLRRCTKKKKRKGKTPLIRYGRYWRIQELLGRYGLTNDETLIIQANRLQERITKPYRIMVKLKGDCMEFTVSPLVPIREIELLTQRFGQCETAEQIDHIFNDFKKYAPIN